MTIEEYLEKPYWVIDILPKQVPANSRGQYFRIAEYYREHPQIDIIYRKFTNILLKLNCYDDMDFCQEGDECQSVEDEYLSTSEEWITNPKPEDIEGMVSKCLSDKAMLYIILKSSHEMITLSGDDTYMTVYSPSEVTLELLASLAISEGLFLWKP